MVSHVFLHVPDDELRAYRYISIGGYHPYSARHMSYIKHRFASERRGPRGLEPV